jgi:hypothetical protein
MDFIDDRQFWWRIKWQWILLIVILSGILVGLIARVLGLFEPLERLSAALVLFSEAIFIIGGLIFAFAALILGYELCQMLRENTDKLESVKSMLADQQKLLKSVDRGVRLSETTKQIAYRDTDWQGLRETVLEKLHKHDFELTDTLIEEISKRSEYSDLASELRVEVDKYKNASEDERAGQIIAYIEKLLEKYQWVKAAEQIERLCNAFPNSEKAQNMPKILKERKDMRKKQLLAEWDQAVKRQETDKSLSILKELDLYLTPSEGLALQESAKDAFRSKLHNFGVKFSIAVADKQWNEAVNTGHLIMKEFPNSRMAVEIRGKMPVLENLAV